MIIKFKFDYKTLYCLKNEQMIKKKEMGLMKRNSLDKPKSSSNGATQKKSKEAIKVDLSKDKGKTNKIDKDHRPSLQQRSKSRSHFQENGKEGKKGSHDVDQIFMKKDLKLLLSKKGIKKSKQVSVVPDILKKIEENCRILKKIDYQQRNPSHKKTSKHSSSYSKSFKHSCCINRSEIPFNKSITKLKQTTIHDAEKGAKKIRHSYEIIKQHKQQQKIQPKAQNPISSKKIVKIAQEYKKSIDREDLKIEKSSKNTNYNSNQSRNSSSMHNSHALFSVLESISKHHHKFQENPANMDKIQGLIKQQQNYIDLSRSQRADVQIQSSRLGQVLHQDKKQSQQIQKINEEKVESHRNSKNSESAIKQSIQNQELIQHQNKNNASQQKDKEKSIRNFEQSKYYVQPIPPFKGKPNKEDSLIGCEITIIENNIIDDSELPQLQL